MNCDFTKYPGLLVYQFAKISRRVVPKIPFCFRMKLTATASANTSIAVTVVRHTSIDRYKVTHYKVKDTVKGYSL